MALTPQPSERCDSGHGMLASTPGAGRGGSVGRPPPLPRSVSGIEHQARRASSIASFQFCSTAERSVCLPGVLRHLRKRCAQREVSGRPIRIPWKEAGQSVHPFGKCRASSSRPSERRHAMRSLKHCMSISRLSPARSMPPGPELKHRATSSAQLAASNRSASAGGEP